MLSPADALGYVTVQELAEELGYKDRSTCRKWLLKRRFEFLRVRPPRCRGAEALALSPADADRARELRRQEGYVLPSEADSEACSIAPNGRGYLYLIQLAPDLKAERIKIGFAHDVDTRLRSHRCSAPTATLARSWPCRPSWEGAAIASITRIGCEALSQECFDCDDLSGAIARGDAFFAVMPAE